MSTKSRPNGKRRVSWSDVAMIVLGLLGVAITALAASYHQLKHNLKIAGEAIVVLYIVGATGALLLMSIRARRRPSSGLLMVGGPVVAAAPHRSDELRTEQLREALTRARKIDAVGIANNVLTSELTVEFYKDFVLRRSGKIRLLFVDPGSQAIRQREAAESRKAGTLSLLVEHNLEDVVRFTDACVAENPSSAGQISVRLYDLSPVLNAIIVDDEVAFVHYYGSQSRGYDVPSFIVTRLAVSEVFQFYMDEFESLWAGAHAWPHEN